LRLRVWEWLEDILIGSLDLFIPELAFVDIGRTVRLQAYRLAHVGFRAFAKAPIENELLPLQVFAQPPLRPRQNVEDGQLLFGKPLLDVTSTPSPACGRRWPAEGGSDEGRRCFKPFCRTRVRRLRATRNDSDQRQSGIGAEPSSDPRFARHLLPQGEKGGFQRTPPPIERPGPAPDRSIAGANGDQRSANVVGVVAEEVVLEREGGSCR